MLSSFYFDNINLCLVNTFSHLYVTSRFSVFDLFLFQTKIKISEMKNSQSFFLSNLSIVIIVISV